MAVLNSWMIHENAFQSAPTPSPMNTVPARAPPFSPATSTSAQAVPSGYGSAPCSLTISAFLSGTIIRTPRMPPANASSRICT